MAEEARVRANPELRAGRFVESWRAMGEQRTRLEKAGDREGAERLRGRMEKLAGGLHRDPQLESALAKRAPELELKMERGRSIGQELTQQIGGRDRDRGMSL